MAHTFLRPRKNKRERGSANHKQDNKCKIWQTECFRPVLSGIEEWREKERKRNRERARLGRRLKERAINGQTESRTGAVGR